MKAGKGFELTNLVSFLDEPALLFRHGQPMIDPRDGLTIFGPLQDAATPPGVRWGVIGTTEGIAKCMRWIGLLNEAKFSAKDGFSRPFFPGFEAAFRCELKLQPAVNIELDASVLSDHAHNADPYQRVYRTVNYVAESLLERERTEEVRPDLWLVVMPDYVSKYCRPMAIVPSHLRTKAESGMSRSRISKGGFLFEEDARLAQEYQHDLNFHHQLKARFLSKGLLTQIVKESTIEMALGDDGISRRKLAKMEVDIDWALSTALYYKAGGKPWKLGSAREGVCYIGLVFKNNEVGKMRGTACCAAQMFLDSGDGVVFKGAIGPWYDERRGHFHLDGDSACELVSKCIDEYRLRVAGNAPRELFIHGRARFSDSEWAGFQRGAGTNTTVTGVSIQDTSRLRLYRIGKYPILRGSTVTLSKQSGYLWTRGMIPRLRTFPGLEVPRPLYVDICRGEANVETVMGDILGLTKLNYNTCRHSDGLPVTLKFADAVGEILTSYSGIGEEIAPLPFKHYI